LNSPISQKSFQEILNGINKREEVKFSKHALERLNQRNITLNKQDITKINVAIEKASKKGVKEALILLDNKAFIASIKNNTIITAATGEQLKENVFTNIDGAVII
jgi:flagellar operon protein